MEMDRKKLEDDIVPKLEEDLSELSTLRESVLEDCMALTTSATKHGELWHQEVDKIVNKLKAEIEDLKMKQLSILEKQRVEINGLMSEAKQSAIDLKKSLSSKDTSFSFSYESKITHFKKSYHIPDLKMSLPNFVPPKINKEDLIQMFGSLGGMFRVLFGSLKSKTMYCNLCG
jgi:dsDNA-specific endonuclease/ATPase MutS2